MAYYSDQGATIMQGVGSYFDGAIAPRPSAFKDGSFGRQVDVPPGALMAFRDGSMGAFFDADDAATPRSFQDGSLGSYFDAAEAAPIARPERYPLRGKLRAYQDGMFGRHLPDAEMPGPEESFEGGIFHALGLPLFINGQEVEGPTTIQHGMPPDGEQAEAISLEQQGMITDNLYSATAHLGFPEGDPRAYLEGSLGPGSGLIPTGLPEGNLIAYDQGILGSALQGLGSLFGGASDKFTIDMTDAQWVKELKSALVVALTNLGITEPINTISDDWYLSPYWNGNATGMTRDWANTYQEKVNPAASTGLLMRDAGSVAYPTPTGIVTMVAQGVGITTEFTPANYPKLYAFMQAQAEGADKFTIVPPIASESEKIRKAGMLSTGNMSLLLLGGVGLMAVGFIGYNLLRK
jgi:hypothetical protein